jgi:hypothetical protein
MSGDGDFSDVEGGQEMSLREGHYHSEKMDERSYQKLSITDFHPF